MGTPIGNIVSGTAKLWCDLSYIMPRVTFAKRLAARRHEFLLRNFGQMAPRERFATR